MFETMSSQCKHELQEIVDNSKAALLRFLHGNASIEPRDSQACSYEVLPSYQLIQSWLMFNVVNSCNRFIWRVYAEQGHL